LVITGVTPLVITGFGRVGCGGGSGHDACGGGGGGGGGDAGCRVGCEWLPHPKPHPGSRSRDWGAWIAINVVITTLDAVPGA
jgi:hypothetical protein